MGDKISQDEKDKIKAAINDLREKIKKEDVEGIKAATETLMKASHKMAEELTKTHKRRGLQGRTSRTRSGTTRRTRSGPAARRNIR